MAKRRWAMVDTEVSKKVYSADEIQVILGIGRTKVYEFLDSVNKKQKPFRVIKIGRVYRIPKDSFDKWIIVENIYRKVKS